jgi:hypothetical protein
MALGDGVRRNIATITEEERLLFINAIKTLDTSAFVYPNNTGHEGADGSGNITYWDMQEQIHKDGHAHGTDVHQGPAFIPWHRAIINHLEGLVRLVDPRLSLHYWDWTTDPRVASGGGVALFTPDFMGTANGNAGPPLDDFESTEKTDTVFGDGIHDHIWRTVGASNAKASGEPDITPNSTILGAGDFTAFHNAAKGAHDTTAHSYIGGTISNAHFSFHDPFVFLLHSNLDRLWAMWQRDPLHPGRLNPATAYDSILADQGLPSNYFDEWIQPWAGVTSGGTADTDLEPWKSDTTKQEHLSYRDPSIIIPAAYDTAPHSSFIVTDRDTFSSFEVENTPNFPRAFYVIYDGFAPNALGNPIAAPTIALRFDNAGGAAVSGMSATLRQVDLEDPGRNPDLPQRITFTYDIHFSDATAFATFTETRNVSVRAQHGGERADAVLHLMKQPNPYLLDGPVSWLSTDVRVFQMRPGMVRAGVSQGNPDTNAQAPFQFIQSLLAAFNAASNDEFHPFRDISEDQQASHLELSRTVGGQRVLNYAVAKVRYRANTTTASNVKLFFRMFSTMVSALDYDTASNYRRAGSGNSAIPLLGRIASDIASIPFFAEPRIDSANADMSTQPDATNRHDIVATAGQESTWYFGCWLDFNQTQPQFPLHPTSDGHFSSRLSILDLVRGHHQCLVAEIYFQPGGTDPIAVGATPASSNRLAQRNLAIAESDNPGTAATHTVQHTLLVKPSAFGAPRDVPVTVAVAAPADDKPRIRAAAVGFEGGFAAQRLIGPDELRLQWGNVPRDTRATLYFPEWEADEILLLAALHPRPNVLRKVDDHTLECKVADVTYLPVPGGRTKDFAGLLTLELPQTIVDGQVFTVSVSQFSGITHKVLGAFQLTIPVRLGEGLLRNQVRKLAVLRHIALAIPTSDRWHPIFERYIGQVGAMVLGLGGDPSSVKPSADDPWTGDGQGHDGGRCVVGRVKELVYDRRGEFTGFALEVDGRDIWFDSCERGIERVVARACREGSTIEVCVHGHGRVERIVVRCC